jgi:hypothetical protein
VHLEWRYRPLDAPDEKRWNRRARPRFHLLQKLGCRVESVRDGEDELALLHEQASPDRLFEQRVHPVGESAETGTVLVRDWGGVTHQVKVLEDGILLRGKRYKSLSEVARVITGSRWSGPLFFGLKAAAKEQNHATQ